MKAVSSKSLLLAATVAAGGLAGVAMPTAAQAQAYINVQIGTPPPPPSSGDENFLTPNVDRGNEYNGTSGVDIFIADIEQALTKV